MGSNTTDILWRLQSCIFILKSIILEMRVYIYMTMEERICGEDGAPMRDAGIQPDGSRMFVCTRDPTHILYVAPDV